MIIQSSDQTNGRKFCVREQGAKRKFVVLVTKSASNCNRTLADIIENIKFTLFSLHLFCLEWIRLLLRFTKRAPYLHTHTDVHTQCRMMNV